jgi:hypothetical protein
MNDTDRTPEIDLPEAVRPTGDPHVGESLQKDALEGLIGRLEVAAEQLRSGDLSTDAAATLVEECAVLANRAGAELERRVHAPARGQGTLL